MLCMRGLCDLAFSLYQLCAAYPRMSVLLMLLRHLGQRGSGTASQHLLSPRTPAGPRYLSLLDSAMPSKTCI
jgi:hypothetical protein